jgi:hypothetical protein
VAQYLYIKHEAVGSIPKKEGTVKGKEKRKEKAKGRKRKVQLFPLVFSHSFFFVAFSQSFT